MPVIEATEALDSQIIVVGCYDPDLSRFCDFLARYSEVAGEHGIRLALEFVPYTSVPSLKVALSVLRKIGSSTCGLVIDPLHLARSGGSPADLAAVEPREIVFAQFCDAPAVRPEGFDLPCEARTRRLFPGDGDLPLADFLSALPAGIEIECEMPRVVDAHVGPSVRARQIFEATSDFLGRWRGSSMPSVPQRVE